jgi:S-methylmethionine-dependent homocysteine/selenocysteine methylase
VITVLDGPMGTELGARGVPTPPPTWSAAALRHAPDVVRAIHHDYVTAGAVVHTANTFRTSRRAAGERWGVWTDEAVRLARAAALAGHRVAGSIAPLEDCYRPDLSPPDPRPEHREMARRLAACGVDLLLCETFPHLREALVAVEEAVATDLETWVSFTAGPSADLLTPKQMARGARDAVGCGASAVLVNCTPVRDTLRFVRAIADCGVPVGAYANAGGRADGLGWDARTPDAAQSYADIAATWIAAGATLVGGCCGTSPLHVRALARRFGTLP